MIKREMIKSFGVLGVNDYYNLLLNRVVSVVLGGTSSPYHLCVIARYNNGASRHP